MDLSEKKCIPCEGGIPALKEKEILEFKKLISVDWKVVDNVRITKEFFFVSYRHTIDFVNKIADIAEAEGHHPVLHIFLGGRLLICGHIQSMDYLRMILFWPPK